MKKSCTLLAVLLLMLGLCVAAAAEEAEPTVDTSGDYYYTLLEDGTLQIMYYSGNETELTVPDMHAGYPVTSIGEIAFFSCASLTSITIPDSVTEIGGNPFAYCYELTDIRVSPDHPVFATIDGVLFHKEEKKLVCYPAGLAATEYQIPKGIRSIGNQAFYLCESLVSITLTEGLNSIGDYAFGGCTSLSSITLPEGLTSIGEGAFSSCESLTSITLPEGLTSIGEGAFCYCDSLTSITLPDRLTVIGTWAFVDCASLTSITIPDSVTEIGGNPFACCYELTDIRVSPDHPMFATIDGVLFHKEEKKLVCYPAGLAATEYQVPKGILSIGENAFYSCSSLTSITLPEGITCIGDWAFSSCESLVSIALPEGVTSIEDYAFNDCTSLKNITLPEGLTSIGEGAFDGCPEDMLFTVVRDSWAAQWCKENGKNYTYTDSLDWLND